MLKYYNIETTFVEVPDSVCLCVNITNCPCHCKGCHSSFLANDFGDELTTEVLAQKLTQYGSVIDCVCLMGGDIDPQEINRLAEWLKTASNAKVCWYSGRQELAKEINVENFDYIKLGPYIEEKGPLSSPSTNQVFYKVENGKLIDITNSFWV